MTTATKYPIVTSLHGQKTGLDSSGRLVTSGGYLSGDGPAAGAGTG